MHIRLILCKKRLTEFIAGGGFTIPVSSDIKVTPRLFKSLNITIDDVFSGH